MAVRKKIEEQSKPKRPPAKTPEARENQLIAMAVDLAEQQLRDGTASSQTISHFLKLGSTREKLEQERLAQENALLHAKIEAMRSAQRVEELYETALNAMRSYSGEQDDLEDEYDD